MKDFRWLESNWKRLTAELTQVPHAVLIHGPRGVGKLALASCLAKLLLCEKPAGNLPCGSCEGCRWFAGGNHPDFRLVQPESLAQEADSDEGSDGALEEERSGKKAKPSTEIKVAQVRALGDFLYVGSHRGARRIALIHPAESMNPNAANALLKGLEEPPASAMFLLVTHAPARLLPTVRSRCVQVAVSIPESRSAADWLKSKGVADPWPWLAFAGGAPLLAYELASGERSAELGQLLERLGRGDFAALGTNTREGLELLAEVLQKRAYDGAFKALAGRSKFGTPEARNSGVSGSLLLDFARIMGRNRALARRPLNPGLFAAELTTSYQALVNYNAKP